jgi:beta-galactosidase
MIDVRAATNAPSVELFLDGESLGRREPAGRLIADWCVPYRPGTLIAVAYNENGLAVALDERRSFGEAVAPRVEDEVYEICIFLSLRAGRGGPPPWENANRRTTCRNGRGAAGGLDNGDATDTEPYSAGSRRMFGGKLLAIVRADAGKTPVLNAEFDRADIPVRKIELTFAGERYLARLLPENATYGDIEWRVTDAAGIDSPLASLRTEEGGRSATLIPRGDGEVYVRCSVRNGRDHAAFISAVSRTLSGYGKPFLDPYAYVSGGLYDASNVPMTNGNERGVATLRGEESHVGFRDLDFGPYGSDTFAIDLFPLESDPFTFEVWEGMPPEGGRKIADLPYDLGSVGTPTRKRAMRCPCV